jgi:hypothetical protein
VAREHLYPVCRPGYKEFTDDDIWDVNEGGSYDYYDIYVNHPEGSLNDRYGQFLLKGGNSSGHRQLIPLYPAQTGTAVVNEGDQLKGQQLNSGNIFCIGAKFDVAGDRWIFGRSTFWKVGSSQFTIIRPLYSFNARTEDAVWFTFMQRPDGRLVCLGSNNWY